MKLLLQAFDRLDLDSDVTLGIIDDGSRMTALREFRPTMDRKEQAFFIGFCDHDDVIAHMQVAPIFVSPSTREGFGITFVAAMAADCVVITTEQEYSAGREVIGDAGFIVDHSAPTLANAIARSQRRASASGPRGCRHEIRLGPNC